MSSHLHTLAVKRHELSTLVRPLLTGLELGEGPEVGGQSEAYIVNIFGIAGLGKSHALEQLFAEFSQHYSTLLIRLAPGEYGTGSLSGERLGVEALLTRLEAIGALRTPLPGGSEPTPERELELVLGLSIDQSRPLLVLIDDAGDFPDWPWLQNVLFRSLVERKHVAIVLTSHRKLPWKYWELENICLSHHLDTFDRTEIEAYLRQARLENLKPLTTNILDFTQGYPLAVRYFVNQLQQDSQPELSPQAARALLSRFSTKTRALLQRLGLIRLAEVDVMAELLRSEDREVDQLRLRDEIVGMLAELTANNALTKNQQGLPRRLAPEVRRAVEATLDPGAKYAIARRLAVIYYRRCMDRPKSQVHAVMEWLYFVSPLAARQSGPTRQQWERELHELFRRANAVNVVDPASATPALFVLFYRDRELIDRLEKDGLLGPVNDMLTQFRDKVDQIQDKDLEQLTSMFFGADFDESCQNVLKELYLRLPVEQLPATLQQQLTFVLALRRIIYPGQARPASSPDETALDEATLRVRISAETRLNPSEIRRVIDFLVERGLLSVEQKSYSFNPLIKSLVAFADEKARKKALLSVTTNSPQ